MENLKKESEREREKRTATHSKRDSNGTVKTTIRTIFTHTIALRRVCVLLALPFSMFFVLLLLLSYRTCLQREHKDLKSLQFL